MAEVEAVYEAVGDIFVRVDDTILDELGNWSVDRERAEPVLAPVLWELILEEINWDWEIEDVVVTQANPGGEYCTIRIYGGDAGTDSVVTLPLVSLDIPGVTLGTPQPEPERPLNPLDMFLEDFFAQPF